MSNFAIYGNVSHYENAHLNNSKLDLKTFKLDEIFTSVGNLFQIKVTLSFKKFLLTRLTLESLHLPC